MNANRDPAPPVGIDPVSLAQARVLIRRLMEDARTLAEIGPAFPALWRNALRIQAAAGQMVLALEDEPASLDWSFLG